MSKSVFHNQIDPSDILWVGYTPFRPEKYRIVKLDDETCFVQVETKESPSDWTAEGISDGVCAEVYMSAFLERNNNR